MLCEGTPTLPPAESDRIQQCSQSMAAIHLQQQEMRVQHPVKEWQLSPALSEDEITKS